MRDWRPRAQDVRRFTEGDCHIFAKAVHDLTGWKLCAFYNPGDPTEPDLHAFVEAPDGRLVDIEGARSAEDFYESWDWPPGHVAYGWPLAKDWKVPVFGDYSRKRARKLAKQLVEHLRTTEAPTAVSGKAGAVLAY